MPRGSYLNLRFSREGGASYAQKPSAHRATPLLPPAHRVGTNFKRLTVSSPTPTRPVNGSLLHIQLPESLFFGSRKLFIFHNACRRDLFSFIVCRIPWKYFFSLALHTDILFLFWITESRGKMCARHVGRCKLGDDRF